jgi:hypothetical protein
MEARQAAEEAKERARRAEAREDYLERFLKLEWDRAVLSGRPNIDFGRPSTFVTPVGERIARAEAAQDAQAAAAERRARREAGLEVDLGPTFMDAAPAEGSSSEVQPSAGSGGVSRSRFPKVTEFRHRGSATPCCCADCIKVRAERVARKNR